MKKIMVVVMMAMVVSGCSSVEYHNGKNSLLVQETMIEPKPMQADIEVGRKISGTAECESLFGFRIKKPQKQTYGADLQVPAGNFAPSDCTRGALYDALSKHNADMIVYPHYTTVKKGEFCIFGWCMHRVDQIIVTGYEGNLREISQMPEEVILERQKQVPNQVARKAGFFGV